MTNAAAIDAKLKALTTSKFRASFHLRSTEREMVEKKGLSTIREHAHDFISKRLTPATPINDGKQTPFRGHPVFIAQHATATCCRSCLFKWHHIEKGRELTPEEQNYVCDVIARWIEKEIIV